MFLDRCFLDYIWRGLSAGFLAATLILAVMALGAKFLRGGALTVTGKRFLNLHYLVLGGVFVGGFFYLGAVDSDLAVACFDHFAKAGEPITLTRLVAECWCLGVVAWLALDLARFLAGVLSARHHQPVRDVRVMKLVRELSQALGVKQVVKIQLTAHATSPHVMGFWRPTLVLPVSLLSLPTAALRAVLAHELAHVRELDGLWIWVELVVRRLLFFHPLMYWVSSNYRATLESAADQVAVREAYVAPRALMDSLLLVAERCHMAPLSTMPSATRGFREIRRRMEALGAPNSPGSFRLLILLAASMLSIAGSMAEARGSARVRAEVESENPQMCRQVVDERILRALVNWQDQTNKCEP